MHELVINQAIRQTFGDDENIELVEYRGLVENRVCDCVPLAVPTMHDLLGETGRVAPPSLVVNVPGDDKPLEVPNTTLVTNVGGPLRLPTLADLLDDPSQVGRSSPVANSDEPLSPPSLLAMIVNEDQGEQSSSSRQYAGLPGRYAECGMCGGSGQVATGGECPDCDGSGVRDSSADALETPMMDWQQIAAGLRAQK